MADKMDKEECVTEVVREIKTRTVNIPNRQTALPGETIFIPLHASCAQLCRIAIIPTFEQMNSHRFAPFMRGKQLILIILLTNQFLTRGIRISEPSQ